MNRLKLQALKHQVVLNLGPETRLFAHGTQYFMLVALTSENEMYWVHVHEDTLSLSTRADSEGKLLNILLTRWEEI